MTTLPAGKTCRDCAHFKRCEMLFSANVAFPSSTSCDWDPSRFIEPVRAVRPAKPQSQKDMILSIYDSMSKGAKP